MGGRDLPFKSWQELQKHNWGFVCDCEKCIEDAQDDPLKDKEA